MTADADAISRDALPRHQAPRRATHDEAVPAARLARDDAYRRDIDGLRAIAVLAVVLFHAFPEAMPGGFVGVDVFFVISGFLISGLVSKRLAEGRFTFADFYVRRAKRILPALLVVLAACCAFGWFALLPDEYRQLGKHVAAGIAFVSNFALWSEAGYFDAAASMKPLLHLWSLGIEEQFYLVWPLALWLFGRTSRRALWLIVAVGVVSFAINAATRHAWPIADFYSPLSRFWELQLGCLLAWMTQRAQGDAMPRRIADLTSIGGALALGVSIAAFDTKLAYPGLWALLPTFGTFLLIAAGPDAWLNRTVLSRAWLVGIGLISYPLYLWHWPILSFASIVANGTPPLEIRVAAVVAGAVLAWLTYVFVERPIRFGTAARRFKIPALIAASLAVGVIGYVTFARDGVPERFAPEVRSLANFQYEYKTDARYPDCWVSAEQKFDGFAPFCANASTEYGHRVVLWGDSHAARLYPGLKAVFGDRIAFSQFTRDGCPPLLGVAYENCQKSNAWVVDEIPRIRPDVVVLFAAWTSYHFDWTSGSHARNLLFATIDALRKQGVNKILVLGPAPDWPGGLPKELYKAWQHGTPFHVVPQRLATGFMPVVAAADAALRKDVVSRDAAYFSINDTFCNEAGCLTRLPEGDTRLVTWDYGHLTTDGALIVANRLAAEGVLP